MTETLRPVEIREYYINKISSGMSRYFYDALFKPIFDILNGENVVFNSFPNHDGRPGKVGGSLPRKHSMPSTEDYKNPTKDYVLPDIPKNILDKLGKTQKPVILKKNIIEKNKEHHPDINIEEYNDILEKGINKADIVFKTKENDDYFNFVHRDENYHPQVLIELSETKENYEIVNFYKIDNKHLGKKLNKAIKRIDNEGGKFLIDIKGKALKVGSLSNLEIDSIYIIPQTENNLTPGNFNIYNSKNDVINALKSGRIYYKDGAFRTDTTFSVAIRKTLEKEGAKYRNGAYYLKDLPVEYSQAIAIVEAQNAAKLAAIGGFLKGYVSKIDLASYIEPAVNEMFKTLQKDILTSAQEKNVPVIELNYVTPKIDVPKEKFKEIKTFWKEYDKKGEELGKALLKAKKEGAQKEQAEIEEKIKELNKETFETSPKVEIDVSKLDFESAKIAKDYTYNMRFWVQKWEDKNIIKMRQDVLEMVKKGVRRPQIEEYFEKTFPKWADKARFLARNESGLASTALKAAQYQKIGCKEFVWGRSSSKEKRELHEKYYDHKFRFDDPPIIDERTGKTGLPKQIWNCECKMLIVVPSLAEIQEARKKNNVIENIKQRFKLNNNPWKYRRFGERQAF